MFVLSLSLQILYYQIPSPAFYCVALLRTVRATETGECEGDNVGGEGPQGGRCWGEGGEGEEVQVQGEQLLCN